MSKVRKRLAAVIALSALVPLCFGGTALAGQGPSSNQIYAHDRLYTGVNAPRDLPNEGKFDQIYPLGPGLKAVSDAAPGDQDYNGGRTNAEQILAAAQAGQITIGPVVRRFECPLIPINDQ